MFHWLLSIILLAFSLSAIAEEDFQKTLAGVGIKPEVIEILVKNDLTSRDVLCLTTTDELTKIGVLLGQAKLIMRFCTPEKPVESGDVSKLSELDLLNRLAINPKDGVALQTLKEKSLVQNANKKTPRWVVVNPDKKLNAEETMKYLVFLNKDTATVQGKFHDKRTTFIEAALGIESDVWTHPLFEDKFITDGLDEFEVDWSGVRLEVLNALLWARKTEHKLFPSHLDGAADLTWQQKAVVDQITDPALKRIVEAYQIALEEKDEGAMAVDVKKKVSSPPAPEKSVQSKTPPPQQPPKTFTNSIGMEFVLIPAGEFKMGASFDDVSTGGSEDELPRHGVKVPSFYMGKYEVTQEQWLEVMASHPSTFKNDKVGGSSKRHPVESISWNDAQEFVKRLNEREKNDKYQYRLPTEAEWEYAARGGTDTIYFFGDDANQLGDYAWFNENSNNMTHPVGQKKPNPFGLYDILGNVWEWTCSRYTDKYDGHEYECDMTNESQHVLRGGSWDRNAHDCRAAYRDWSYDRNYNYGFRVVVLR